MLSLIGWWTFQNNYEGKRRFASTKNDVTQKSVWNISDCYEAVGQLYLQLTNRFTQKVAHRNNWCLTLVVIGKGANWDMRLKISKKRPFSYYNNTALKKISLLILPQSWQNFHLKKNYEQEVEGKFWIRISIIKLDLQYWKYGVKTTSTSFNSDSSPKVLEMEQDNVNEVYQEQTEGWKNNECRQKLLCKKHLR